jgi:hypothetical protein
VQRLSDIIRPGGFLYLTVPAFDWLWSNADVDAMHHRRYTRRTLIDVLTGSFEVMYSTYLFQRLGSRTVSGSLDPGGPTSTDVNMRWSTGDLPAC